MDEFTVDAFVNRDEPIPVVNLDPADDLSDDAGFEEGTPRQGERRRDRLRRHASNMKENVRKAQDKASETGSSIQDRLLEKLLQQVIPTEDLPSQQDNSTSHPFIERPSFNITTMSANFRRFNARIGVVFVFQAKVLRLLSWKTVSHTLSFLAIYTFICLDPYLLSVLPLVILLLALLIPAFIARHPAPPTTLTSTNPNFSYNTAGPPLAPAPTVKPVKELSKDFFRNMRDLQNSMEDFSRAHDKIITLLTPPTNFSDEPLSSTLFLFTFATAGFMFIASHLMPWRFIFLIIGWTVTGLGHPIVQRQMLRTHESHIAPREAEAQTWLETWIKKDIILDTAPETREVEIFELQHLTQGSGEWESWLFCPNPYDPLSMERVRGDRAKGTRFFEDVQPPPGWEWSEKKWALDLWSREWVEERIITGVEVETEGERWVYDIRYEYGDDEEGHGYTHEGMGTPTNGKGKGKMMPTWEEGSDVEIGESRRRGEWRRRRWVRMVKRKWQSHNQLPEIRKLSLHRASSRATQQ